MGVFDLLEECLRKVPKIFSQMVVKFMVMNPMVECVRNLPSESWPLKIWLFWGPQNTPTIQVHSPFHWKVQGFLGLNKSKISGQIIIIHQPPLPRNSRGFPFQNATFLGFRSCEVAIIWPDIWIDLPCPKNPRWMNLYYAGVFGGPQNSNFWGVRILRVGYFLYLSEFWWNPPLSWKWSLRETLVGA